MPVYITVPVDDSGPSTQYVTTVAFSRDGTCLANDQLVLAVKLNNYAVAVNFPGPGTYTLCLPIIFESAGGTTLYTAQADARVTVQRGMVHWRRAIHIPWP